MIGLANGVHHLNVWLHMCYQDTNPVTRFFEDLERALGSVHFGRTHIGKMRQLRKYPAHRCHVLAIGLPHTLIRFAEGEDKVAFRDGVVQRIQTWQRVRCLHENKLDRRAEFALCTGQTGALTPVIWYGFRSSARSFVKSIVLMEFGHFGDQRPTATLYRYPVIIGVDPSIETAIAPQAGWSNP